MLGVADNSKRVQHIMYRIRLLRKDAKDAKDATAGARAQTTLVVFAEGCGACASIGCTTLVSRYTKGRVSYTPLWDGRCDGTPGDI